MPEAKLKIIDADLLDRLSGDARGAPRRRKNFNLHDDYAEPCQRLLNALEPGTYVRPHRHSDPPKPECFLALRGRMALVLFRDDGGIDRVVPFGAAGPVYGVDLPAGVWHAILVLEPGCLFFETKPGPYQPLTDKDFAPWAPEEGDEAAVEEYLAMLARAVKQSELDTDDTDEHG